MNTHQRRKELRRQSRNMEREGGSQHRIVRHWADLAEIPPSKTHRLEINVEGCNGWIRPICDDEALGDYLSTHTFYGSKHRYSTALLRKRGFNVTCVNWDA